MKYLVLYTSKTGFTKKYADWIAEELGCSAVPAEKSEEKIMNDAEFIVYGGWIKAGKIQGLGRIKKAAEDGGKKLAVFAVGAASSEMKDVIDKMWKQNFTEKELENIIHFYFEGGLNYDKMGFVNRSMMNMMKKMLSKSRDVPEDDIWMVERIKGDFDNTDRDSIDDLVESLKKI